MWKDKDLKYGMSLAEYCLFPFMVKMRDRRHGEPILKIDPPPPFLPKNSLPKKMIRIGELYESMGYYCEALNVYIETTYLSALYSEGKADLWLKNSRP